MKCPHCGEEISGITCPECGRDIPEESNYCLYCGAGLEDVSGSEAQGAEAGEDGEVDFEDRIPCPDGNCIGIIVNGRCNVCGKPYKGKQK
ncbi:MAG: zinc-ribbon domain-containing protein [Thermodesulfobacteriota bacterium]